MTDAHIHPLLLARGISKSFPGVQALDAVDLDLRAGEVLAVVGENGAGKSTLMKILAGIESPDAGSISLGGIAYTPRHVHDAHAAGVALVHQELNLAGNLDIASNICLGREPSRIGFVDRKAVRAMARRALDSIGLHEPIERRVDDLSIGHRQLVEIARALALDARVLILDEPTSSLTQTEAERLFATIHDLRERGVAIIYISHRLAEVEAIADRVVVLRDGHVSGRLDRDAITRDAMVQGMIGRSLAPGTTRVVAGRRTARLELSGLRTQRFPGVAIDLAVGSGEIVGIAGLVGAGRTELLQAIFGEPPPVAGRVSIDGDVVDVRSPRDAISAGLALVPEDRQKHGLVLEQSVRRNIGLPEYARRGRRGFVDRAHERVTAGVMVDRMRIRVSSDRQVAGALSGGNQQKVVLGKWLALEPGILLLDEPTRGIDVGSRAEIYAIMEGMAGSGVAILFASSDMEEVLAMSDRVVVMRDGAVAGMLDGDMRTEEAIMRLATGDAA